jgi:hypothetical protein
MMLRLVRQISAQALRFAILRSGVSEERRKLFEIKEFGFYKGVGAISMTKENISIPKETFSLVKETPSLVMETTRFWQKLDAWTIGGEAAEGRRSPR